LIGERAKELDSRIRRGSCVAASNPAAKRRKSILFQCDVTSAALTLTVLSADFFIIILCIKCKRREAMRAHFIIFFWAEL